jgi:hypothetical protein
MIATINFVGTRQTEFAKLRCTLDFHLKKLLMPLEADVGLCSWGGNLGKSFG